MNLMDAASAYAEKFGSTPTIMALPPDKWEAAGDALQKAIDDDAPFADDAAFFAAIDLEAPPDDAVI